MFESVLSRRTLFLGAGALALSAHGVTAQASPRWHEVHPTGERPPARWDHHLAADADAGMLMVYGGRDDDGNAFDDTWLFDLETLSWSRLESSGPPARFGSAHGASGDGGQLLFGGQAGSTFYNDTWRFDFASRAWDLLDDGAAIAPTPRYGLGGATDNAGNFFISHGFTFEGRFDDSWSYNPRSAQWSNKTPDAIRPLNRCLHEVIAVPDSDVSLLYGGCSSGYGPCPQGDLWSFDSGTGLWSELTPAIGPAARYNPSLVWSESLSGAVIFGGQTDAGKSSDLWIGTPDEAGFTWTELGATGDRPAARASHDAVVVDSTIYLFGGLTDVGSLADLWALEF